MRNTLLIAAAVLTLSAGSAWARHCPKDMAQIDAALSQNPKVSSATLAQVKDLRAKGEELHKAGKHPESEQTLAQAKQLLGIQ